MASGKSSKAVRSARAAVVVKRSRPWGTVAAVTVVVLFAGSVFGYFYYRYDQKKQHAAALAQYTPSETNKDPSDKIAGVVKVDYPAAKHVTALQRVAYDKSPPFGGPHDETWAACNGVVYDKAVRTENMVHPLEHGAVWIAYNPDQIKGPALDTLKAKVTGQQYLMLSPYPGLDQPISLQSWGHQLKLASETDPRVDQFIQALRTNQYTYPETGATCDEDPTVFDPANPPPFDASPLPPDAVPMTGGDSATNEAGMPAASGQAPAPAPASGQAPASGAAPAPAPASGQAPAPATSAPPAG